METKKQVVSKQETKQEVKVILTIASVFKHLASQGVKDRKTLANNIITFLKEKGVTTNGKGKEIVKKNVLQQISAMTRDINNKRGSETKSWWSLYTVEETDKTYKIVAN